MHVVVGSGKLNKLNKLRCSSILFGGFRPETSFNNPSREGTENIDSSSMLISGKQDCFIGDIDPTSVKF